MPRTVEFHDDFELAVESAVQDALLAVAKLLADYGPQLGRPYAETLKGSKHANMKELRFEASDGEWRVASAFDRRRHAILLVAGDKSGGSQKRFHRQLIQRRTSGFQRIWKPERRRDEMGRNLDQVIAELPPERRECIDARYRELKQEVAGLRELREIAGKAQLDVAAALHIKQPSVSKIEKQTDMYLSTLRSYIEAIGGQLELTVKLPRRPALKIHHLGDVVAPVAREHRASRGGGAAGAR